MKAIIAGLGALALAGTTPAFAEDDPDFIASGLGWYDVLDEYQAIDLRLEYRSHYKLLGFVKPWAGIEATSDAALYGVAGILVDLYFGRRMVLTPSFGVGLYSDGDGKGLGNTVEFRSQLELGYRFDDRSRLGVAISHISNGGLGTDNPGAEVATVYYHLPVRNLFGE